MLQKAGLPDGHKVAARHRTLVLLVAGVLEHVPAEVAQKVGRVGAVGPLATVATDATVASSLCRTKISFVFC